MCLFVFIYVYVRTLIKVMTYNLSSCFHNYGSFPFLILVIVICRRALYYIFGKLCVSLFLQGWTRKHLSFVIYIGADLLFTTVFYSTIFHLVKKTYTTLLQYVSTVLYIRIGKGLAYQSTFVYLTEDPSLLQEIN